ncbi:MAG: type II toxin-antitoxin system VapC family toxin [Desulfococcaceae bacterium]
MILLDTNVLSELMSAEPNEHVIRWIDDHYPINLYICAVTRAEIELGILLLPEGKRKKQLAGAANEMFSDFSGRCLSFDESAAVEYAKLAKQRRNMGRPISVEDGQIAAIAIANRLILATRNVKDFEEISELNIMNPWCASGS